MKGRRLLIALALAVSWLTGAASAANHVVQVVDSTFVPAQVTIQTGDTVTFQKSSTSLPHNVVSDGFSGGCAFGPTCFRCGGGNGCQGQGASGNATTTSFNVTLDFFGSAGTFRYYCDIHGGPGGAGMAGSIVVEEGAPPPPPPPPPPSDDPGSIRFTSSNYNRNEGIGTAVIQVERVGGDDGAVGVSFATSNGSATAGADYDSTNGSLAWADGEDGVKTFDVTITDDSDDEPSETVNLALSSPTGGATLGSPSNATLTIADNDEGPPGVTPTLSFTETAFAVGEAEPFATLTVGRAGGTQGTVSVDYDTSNGSAIAGQDYTASSGTVNWGDGDGADKSFQVPILDDTELEDLETFFVTLSQATGGAVVGSPSMVPVDLTDNEGLPACEDGEFQMCLLQRFLVRIRWVRQNGQSGDARATKLSDSAASFEFFEAGNIEAVVKMRDGCGFPPGNPLRNYWVFVAGLTNVRVELTVIDTHTGAMRRFYNQLNQPFFTPAPDSPDGHGSPPGAIQATTESLGAFPTCDL